MSNKSQRPPGRISLRGDGVGDLTHVDIEQRAREIAVIEGRAPERITEVDREHAWHELQNRPQPATDDDGMSRGTMSRDPSEPVSVPGRQIPNQEPEDDGTVVERLTHEGVEEAQHDQMLAARAREHRQNRQ